MNKIKNIKAVILAAGRGVRIQGIAGEKPKSLLEIGIDPASGRKVTFLQRQINCLRNAGVNDICVVVGYNKDQIYKALESENVTIVENAHPDISASGSLHSFQYAFNSEFNPLSGEVGCLLMDADIVYEQRVLSDFVDSLDKTSLLISSNINTDSEEVRIYGESEKPVFIGKGLHGSLVNDMPCLGEATGIVYFGAEDHTLVKDIANWMLGNPKATDEMKLAGFGPAKIKTEHEELTQRLMLLSKMDSFIMEKERIFMEVDFGHEYDELVNGIYDSILEADQEAK